MIRASLEDEEQRAELKVGEKKCKDEGRDDEQNDIFLESKSCVPPLGKLE